MNNCLTSASPKPESHEGEDTKTSVAAVYFLEYIRLHLHWCFAMMQITAAAIYGFLLLGFDRCQWLAAAIEPVHFDRLSVAVAIHGCLDKQ